MIERRSRRRYFFFFFAAFFFFAIEIVTSFRQIAVAQ